MECLPAQYQTIIPTELVVFCDNILYMVIQSMINKVCHTLQCMNNTTYVWVIVPCQLNEDLNGIA